MTQLPEVPAGEQLPATISAKELEAALNRTLSPRVSEKIKRSLIAALQAVTNEVDDD